MPTLGVERALRALEKIGKELETVNKHLYQVTRTVSVHVDSGKVGFMAFVARTGGK